MPSQDLLYEARLNQNEMERLLIKGKDAEMLNALGFPVDDINRELMGEMTYRTADDVFDQNISGRVDHGYKVPKEKLNVNALIAALNKDKKRE